MDALVRFSALAARTNSMGFGPLLTSLFLALVPSLTRGADLDLRLAGRWPTGSGFPASKVVTDGQHAFVLAGDYSTELAVIDLTDRTRLQRVARRPMTGARDLALDSSHLFVAALNNGLRIINVQSPAQPKLQSTLNTTGLVIRVAVSGGFAGVIEIPRSNPDPGVSPGRLRIADVHDPAHPRWTGEYPIDADQRSSPEIVDVAMSEGVICVASDGYNPVAGRQEATLEIFDIADPARPRRAGVHRAPGLVHGVSISGRRALWAPYQLKMLAPPIMQRLDSSAELLSLEDLDHPRLLSSLTTVNDRVREVALDNSRAYLASGPEGAPILDVLDLSTPNTLRSLGRTVLFAAPAAWAYSLAQTAPGTVLVASSGGMKHLDVTDPAQAVVLSSLEPEARAASTATQGDLVVVTYPTRGTEWLDIRDPNQVRRVGSLDLNGYQVVTSGPWALLKGTTGGVHVVDASNPAEPRKLSTMLTDSAQNISDLLVTYPTAFVADRDTGLYVIDLTDPQNPIKQAHLPPREPGANLSLAQSGQHLLVAQNRQRGPFFTGELLDVIDVRDPAKPSLLNTISLRGEPSRIAVNGHYAYLAEWAPYSSTGFPGIIEIFDLTDPANPRSLAPYDCHGDVDNLSVSDERLFFSVSERDRLGVNGPLQLQVFDIRAPDRPYRIGSYAFPSMILGGFQWSTVGDHLLLTGLHDDIPILDIGRPAALKRQSNTDTPGLAMDVAVLPENPGWAVVADGSKGIRLYDVQVPDQPRLAGSVPISTGSAERLSMDGSIAYVAAREGGLKIFDVANPQLPKLIHTQRITNSNYFATDITEVMVRSGKAFLADANGGIRIFDVQSPEAPKELGAWPSNGTTMRIASLGDLLVLACGGAGLQIVDVSNPQVPLALSQVQTLGTIAAVAIHGDRAYVADGVDGFTILDLSHPATPSVLGSAPGPCLARDIVVSGPLAYVGDAYAGIRVFDCTDVSHPREIGGTTAADAWGLALLGDRVLAAGGYSGLWTFAAIAKPLKLELISGSETNTRVLRLDGPAGTQARLHQSTDLRTWVDLSSVVLGESPTTVSIPFSPSAPATFFRLSTS